MDIAIKGTFMEADDQCYKLFTKYGFTWGGDWKNSKDYQHFEKDL
ncbi:MAG: M15 family metallopeptidase [Lachnospiraceae bacterium]|nr:M15 family metallopeptidase [Lachnospiraceae bacterium]